MTTADRVSVGIDEWLPLSAQRQPDRVCFVDTDGSSYTFAEVNRRVNRLVHAMADQGVQRGDRVAVMAADSHQYAETILAAMKLGAVYMPINCRLARPEVETLIDRGCPSIMFYSQRYREVVDGLDKGPGPLRTLVGYDMPGGPGESYEPFLNAGHDGELPRGPGDDELFGLAFTSGTTGLPKGVMQSRRMIKHGVLNGLVTNRADPEDFRYCASPLFHVTGVFMMLSGVALGYRSLLLPQFDVELMTRYLVADELTACFFVPTMISMLLQREELRHQQLRHLKLIIYGAAPMPPNLLRQAMDTFRCDFINLFGAGTEAGLQAMLTVEDHKRAVAGDTGLLGSIGRPPIGVALRLTDEDMKDVAVGEIGEITTRSDTVMDGYLDMPEATARSLRDGWFRAGDLASADRSGFLYLAGRKDDMIIRGGENIYPVEIESVIAEHPSVALVAVVGVPDDHWGETVRAWIVARQGAVVEPNEVAQLCRERLAHYKIPADYRVVDELPMNASGKILKRRLRSMP